MKAALVFIVACITGWIVGLLFVAWVTHRNHAVLSGSWCEIYTLRCACHDPKTQWSCDCIATVNPECTGIDLNGRPALTVPRRRSE